jgi:hypothetical protein
LPKQSSQRLSWLIGEKEKPRVNLEIRTLERGLWKQGHVIIPENSKRVLSILRGLFFLLLLQAMATTKAHAAVVFDKIAKNEIDRFPSAVIFFPRPSSPEKRHFPSNFLAPPPQTKDLSNQQHPTTQAVVPTIDDVDDLAIISLSDNEDVSTKLFLSSQIVILFNHFSHLLPCWRAFVL